MLSRDFCLTFVGRVCVYFEQYKSGVKNFPRADKSCCLSKNGEEPKSGSKKSFHFGVDTYREILLAIGYKSFE